MARLTVLLEANPGEVRAGGVGLVAILAGERAGFIGAGVKNSHGCSDVELVIEAEVAGGFDAVGVQAEIGVALPIVREKLKRLPGRPRNQKSAEADGQGGMKLRQICPTGGAELLVGAGKHAGRRLSAVRL